MARRSYDQYCPLAYALDALGERWTLLIVRELAFGPRRFTDLLAGLPGIGTNLLTDRLRHLERLEVVVRETLPPPAASTVYRLGAASEQLMPALAALAAWGMRFLTRPPTATDFVGTAPTVGYLHTFYDPAVPGRLRSVELDFGREPLHLELGEKLAVTIGSRRTADLEIATAPHVLLNALAGTEEMRAAVARGEITVNRGDAADAVELARRFPFRRSDA